MANKRKVLIIGGAGLIGPIMIDERRIAEVLRDLIDNAIMFTPSGGAVAIGARREGDEVALWIADTGPGIEPDQVEAAFGTFHRGATRRGHEPGVGLGLSLAKSFIELHGGRVDIESEPGRGTRVTCTIPCPQEPAAQTQDHAPRLAVGA